MRALLAVLVLCGCEQTVLAGSSPHQQPGTFIPRVTEAPRDAGTPPATSDAGWTKRVVAPLRGGSRSPQLVLDARDDEHVLYADATDAVLWHATRTGAGPLIRTRIEAFTPGTALEVLPRPVFDGSGNLHVLYLVNDEVHWRVKLAAGEWQAAERVPSLRRGLELMLEFDGSPVIVARGEGELRVHRRLANGWQASTLDRWTGQTEPSLAVEASPLAVISRRPSEGLRLYVLQPNGTWTNTLSPATRLLSKRFIIDPDGTAHFVATLPSLGAAYFSGTSSTPLPIDPDASVIMRDDVISWWSASITPLPVSFTLHQLRNLAGTWTEHRIPHVPRVPVGLVGGRAVWTPELVALDASGQPVLLEERPFSVRPDSIGHELVRYRGSTRETLDVDVKEQLALWSVAAGPSGARVWWSPLTEAEPSFARSAAGEWSEEPAGLRFGSQLKVAPDDREFLIGGDSTLPDLAFTWRLPGSEWSQTASLGIPLSAWTAHATAFDDDSRLHSVHRTPDGRVEYLAAGEPSWRTELVLEGVPSNTTLRLVIDSTGQPFVTIGDRFARRTGAQWLVSEAPAAALLVRDDEGHACLTYLAHEVIRSTCVVGDGFVERELGRAPAAELDRVLQRVGSHLLLGSSASSRVHYLGPSRSLELGPQHRVELTVTAGTPSLFIEDEAAGRVVELRP